MKILVYNAADLEKIFNFCNKNTIYMGWQKRNENFQIYFSSQNDSEGMERVKSLLRTISYEVV